MPSGIVDIVAVTNLRLTDYATLTILTSVGYDYVLTFSDEVEYIWTKPWTVISTLFILIRYAGLCYIVGKYSLTWYHKAVRIYSTPRVISPCDLNPLNRQCEVIYIIRQWLFPLYLCAANSVMVLRVWAMYGRSRLILSILFGSFVPVMISMIICTAIFSNPKNFTITTQQILHWSTCEWQQNIPAAVRVTTVLQMIHGVALCTLAVAQFVRQSFHMYLAMNVWQVNRYMNLLVKQGVLYVIVIFLVLSANLLTASKKYPHGGCQMVLIEVLECVPLLTLPPRFIMSIRAMYAREVQSICGGEVDTWFGLSSGRDAGGTAIIFADTEQKEISEKAEEISREADVGWWYEGSEGTE